MTTTIATNFDSTVLAVLKAGAASTVSWTPPGGQAASTGIYAALTGTAPSCTVVYG